MLDHNHMFFLHILSNAELWTAKIFFFNIFRVLFNTYVYIFILWLNTYCIYFGILSRFLRAVIKLLNYGNIVCSTNDMFDQ